MISSILNQKDVIFAVTLLSHLPTQIRLLPKLLRGVERLLKRLGHVLSGRKPQDYIAHRSLLNVMKLSRETVVLVSGFPGA